MWSDYKESGEQGTISGLSRDPGGSIRDPSTKLSLAFLATASLRMTSPIDN